MCNGRHPKLAAKYPSVTRREGHAGWDLGDLQTNFGGAKKGSFAWSTLYACAESAQSQVVPHP